METLFHSRQSHESVDQSDSRGAVVVETLQFTDRSTSDPVEKARRYLIAMGDHRINSAYFYDDGYPKQACAMGRTHTASPRKEASMTVRWALAQWCLSIWNPDLMDFLPDTRRKQKRLFYKAMGLVTHDRALNGRPAWH